MTRWLPLLAELQAGAAHRLAGVASLALRLYLAPVFWVAGWNKAVAFDEVVHWFSDADWGLGLPFPRLMAALATGAELGGSVLLALGWLTRAATVPLMVTMAVAAITVHAPHGWQAVHDLRSPWPSIHAEAALDRLERARALLQEHGDYAWLTEHGRLVMSNNGMEWAITYLVMLVALFVLGGGRGVSLDHWISKRLFRPRVSTQ